MEKDKASSTKPLGNFAIVAVRTMYILIHVVLWLVFSAIASLFTNFWLGATILGILILPWFLFTFRAMKPLLKRMAKGTFDDDYLDRHSNKVMTLMKKRRREDKENVKIF